MTNQSQKIWVTGGAGYIGSNCVEVLLDRGFNVLVFDNLSEGHRSAVDPRAHFVQGDLADAPSLAAAMRDFSPHAVLHFAAHALVGESMTDPLKYFRNNVVGGIHLLDAMRGAGVNRIVFSSTCATYGIPELLPITEATPQRPVNPYGCSKRMFEEVLEWVSSIHGLVNINLRYFNAAGAGPRFGEHHRIESHLIPNIIFAAQGRRPAVQIFGTDYPTPDGTCVRDYIHILDLAEAHYLALSHPQSASFNLGTGRGHSVREVIASVERISGRRVPVELHPRRPGDPPVLVADATLAREVLGWSPQFTSIDSIVQSAWNWHEAHPDGYAD